MADYTKAIELDPNNAYSYDARGFAYASQGNYEQANADYTKALELNQNSYYAYCNRAFANLNLKQGQAIADYWYCATLWVKERFQE